MADGGRSGLAWGIAIAAIVTAACSSTDDAATDVTAGTRDAGVDTNGDVAGGATGATAAAASATPLPMPPVSTSPAAVELDLVIDDETGLPVEVEAEPLPPLTYDEIVDRGVEAGIWTEADGLARAIGHAAGLVPDDALPGAASLVDGAFTSLLARANELAASDTLSGAELANLQFFFEAAMPSEETRERLVATAVGGVEPAGPGEGVRPRQAAASCAPVDPGGFSRSAWVEGCFRADLYDVAGHPVRIIYPDWFDADETSAGWPLFAFEVVRQSYETYAGLGTIGPLDILFAPTDTNSGTYGIAVSDAQWQRATISGPCPIVIFPNAQATDLRFRQTLAHEIWHCVQHYSAGMQPPPTNPA